MAMTNALREKAMNRAQHWEMRAWCEDDNGNTITKPCIMNVWVYPEIHCEDTGVRWKLLSQTE
ncbi:MAG: hypothetical protein JW941_07145, partial [Candidatus Coatesbacteria bacterium]|nr:hypothetical protein [Candidatus Coatesbacteria bacterium]